MSKPKKTMKGVTCKNGYWYARIDGQEKYCGKGEKGYKLAKTARMKWEVRMWLIPDILPKAQPESTLIILHIS